MAKEYKPKSIATGFKLGFRDDKSTKKFYAVPTHKLPAQVILFNKSELITIDTPYVYENTFDDKFGRGTYTLRYYPVKENEK
jgi:hypothetical protein